MEPKTLTFTTERETKHTIRFQERTEGKPPAISTLYVLKWLLGENRPSMQSVTSLERAD